ncbi:hypothetical protein [Planktotalea sp.]|uniref:hypothetical protein n=1 Tax=Planktotalea sp. TaxID=2029877 RepID=UPI003D6B7C50
MSALRKTTLTFETRATDLHSGVATELFSSGSAPSMQSDMLNGEAVGAFTAGASSSFDGAHTELFTSGSAPSRDTTQMSGSLCELFTSGS